MKRGDGDVALPTSDQQLHSRALIDARMYDPKAIEQAAPRQVVDGDTW
jgi:hypothetical protein